MKKKVELDSLPVYEIVIDEDDKSGIRFVSLVADPAIDIKGMFFSKEDLLKNERFTAIPDQMKIVGPAMIPMKKIYRKDNPDDNNDPGYFVIFKPNTIKLMVDKFNRDNNNRSINVDHSNRTVNGFIQQNWIIEDPVYDKSKMYGYNLQPGSWFIEMKIEDEKFWNEDVKELGKYSFSIEGLMGQKIYEYWDQYNMIDTLTDEEIFELLDFI